MDPRGAMRRRIVALIQAHPEGLTPAEMRPLLGVDRSLADTCLGMGVYTEYVSEPVTSNAKVKWNA